MCYFITFTLARRVVASPNRHMSTTPVATSAIAASSSAGTHSASSTSTSTAATSSTSPVPMLTIERASSLDLRDPDDVFYPHSFTEGDGSVLQMRGTGGKLDSAAMHRVELARAICPAFVRTYKSSHQAKRAWETRMGEKTLQRSGDSKGGPVPHGSLVMRQLDDLQRRRAKALQALNRRLSLGTRTGDRQPIVVWFADETCESIDVTLDVTPRELLLLVADAARLEWPELFALCEIGVDPGARYVCFICC
jgi:hypothetical protein